MKKAKLFSVALVIIMVFSIFFAFSQQTMAASSKMYLVTQKKTEYDSTFNKQQERLCIDTSYASDNREQPEKRGGC